MYLLELHDILFVNKFIKTPIAKFNITSYINFNSASNRLIPPRHLNDISQHLIFTDCYLCGMLCLFLS